MVLQAMYLRFLGAIFLLSTEPRRGSCEHEISAARLSATGSLVRAHTVSAVIEKCPSLWETHVTINHQVLAGRHKRLSAYFFFTFLSTQ